MGFPWKKKYVYGFTLVWAHRSVCRISNDRSVIKCCPALPYTLCKHWKGSFWCFDLNRQFHAIYNITLKARIYRLSMQKTLTEWARSVMPYLYFPAYPFANNVKDSAFGLIIGSFNIEFPLQYLCKASTQGRRDRVRGVVKNIFRPPPPSTFVSQQGTTGSNY